MLPPDSEGPSPAFELGFKVGFTLNREEFTALQAMIDTAARSRERLRDGQWSLAVLFDAYALLLHRIEQREQQLALIHKWRRQSPRSAAAALIEARYWITSAMIALGPGGPLASAPASARTIFDQRARMARSVLEASKPYAASNPLWYHEMLTVATLQRWSDRKKAALLDAAVKAEPTFETDYVAIATSFAPHWGGSLAQYQSFVDAAVEKTRPIAGESMYAILYVNLIRVEKYNEPFGQLDIPWAKMKAGYISLLERYPESDWHLQNFAYFACRAGDAATFLSLLPKVSKSKRGGLWSDVYTLEYCRSLYTKPA